MSDARSAILSTVSATLAHRRGGQPAPAPASIAAEAAALAMRAYATRPDRGAGSLDAAFLARVISPAVSATAERVAVLRDFPDAVRRYLTAHGLAASVALQPHPDLGALDWSGVEMHDRIGLDEPVAVGLARGGIAETGSLVFHSAPGSPTLFAFLPVHHIVAVAADRIWSGLEDYADAFAGTAQPRNVNLITGASGTTDIEGTLVRGAHGPGHLHVVLIGGMG
jgi:L-lactate dehydrogenase complex protein LldG